MTKKDRKPKTINRTERRDFLKKSLLGASGLFMGSFGLSAIKPLKAVGQRISTKSTGIVRKLRPVLEGDWWLVGRAPADLKPREGTHVEPVDHHILKANDGYWHLWGCVRRTEVGRVLYHWRSKNLEDSPWEETGEYMRCDFSYGECIDDWEYYGGKEWMQSPYFVRDFYGKYYMFYGGHSTGKDMYGNPAPGNSDDETVVRSAQCQICLMTSDDGVNWTRHKNKDGYSRVFVGPGETRDPSLINIDGLWYMYYAGERQHKVGGVYLRTSKDLINWSDYEVVHYDPTFGKLSWDHECPHVVYRDGYFYLFKTESYRDARTYVYRSQNPRDFGVGAEYAQELYVGEIACAAPEIYQANGKEYVSSNHNPPLGTQMCQLKWVPE